MCKKGGQRFNLKGGHVHNYWNNLDYIWSSHIIIKVEPTVRARMLFLASKVEELKGHNPSPYVMPLILEMVRLSKGEEPCE